MFERQVPKRSREVKSELRRGMRKWSGPVLAGVLVACAMLALPSTSDAVQRWERTYGPGMAKCVVVTSDSGYILCGQAPALAGCIKVDGAGDSVWGWTDTTTTCSDFSAAVATPDGGSAFAGMFTVFVPEETTDEGFPWHVKLDRFGQLQWSRIHREEWACYATALAACHDGGFILIGNNNNPDGTQDAWLSRTDSLGITSWSRSYSLGDEYFDRTSGVAETPDRGFVLAGVTRPPGMCDWIAWLRRTDSLGNLLWAHTYGRVIPYYEYDFHAVLNAPGGGFLAAGGLAVPESTGRWDAWLVRTDDSGRVVWQRTYDLRDDEMIYSLAPTSDGGYILGGYTGWLMKTDSLGREEWHSVVGADDWHPLRDAKQALDGGYIAVGTHPWMSFGAVKTDEYGSTAVVEDGDRSVRREGLKLEALVDGRARYVLAEPGMVEAGLFDAVGRRRCIVFRGRQTAGCHEIDIPAIGRGLMFLRVTAGSGTAVAKLVNLR